MERNHRGHELLADEVAFEIRRKIQRMELKPGERLTVRKLCAAFGTSETPVKQALNQLVTSGLVVSIPNSGMRVREFNFRDMKNIWEARMMIELYCVPSAIERARHDENFTREIRSVLRLSKEEYQRCVNEFSLANFVRVSEHDRMLHSKLVECSRNIEIIRIYEALNAHSAMFMGYKYHTPNSLSDVSMEHEAIVAQMMMGDEAGMYAAIRKHIYSTTDIYRQALETDEEK